jgi:hypothetical protein
MLRKHTYRHMLCYVIVRMRCLARLFHCTFKGTQAFQEVRSVTFRSLSYRLLHEQHHQSGTGSRHVLRTYDLILTSQASIEAR